MRRRTKIIGSGIALALLVLAVWLAFPPGKRGHVGSFTIRPDVRELRELDAEKAPPHLVVWVTNNSVSNLSSYPLWGPGMAAPDVVLLKGMAAEVVWQGGRGQTTTTFMNGSFSDPRQVWQTGPRYVTVIGPITRPELWFWHTNTAKTFLVPLPAGPGRVERVRVIVGYNRKAGKVQRLISSVTSKAPVMKHLPDFVVAWLFNDGLLDGRLHLRSETAWVSVAQDAGVKEASQ